MSSSLSVVAREDINIQTGLDPSVHNSSSASLDDLWNLLRATNVDAARSSAVDFIDFVSTCVYVATIQKDVGSWELAGVVFLTPAAGAGGETEYNMGFAVLPAFTNDGLATQLVAHTLSIAFDALGAHRVQARVLHSDSVAPAPALRALVGWGFAHEGVQRRAFMHPIDRCWVDGSVLALLASDWATRVRERPASQTLWDEMFTRHQREREELLRWDNTDFPPLKRSASNETIRLATAEPSGGQSLSSIADTPHEAARSEVGLRDNRSGDGDIGDDDAPSPPPSEIGTAMSWDALSHTTSSDSDLGIVHIRINNLPQAAAADDAADEFSSEWDELDDDDVDDDAIEDEDEDEQLSAAQSDRK